MKKSLIIFALLAAASVQAAPPAGYCEVQVCNKIERFSLNLWSHVKDNMGKTCFNTTLPKEHAVVGRVLSSDSRWFQGSSINPTKNSVTKVERIVECGPSK